MGNTITTTDMLKRALSGVANSQREVAANISNIDTPGYQPVHTDFTSALKAQMHSGSAGPGMPLRTSNEAHITLPGTDDPYSSGSTINSLLQRNDGSGVDVEQEAMLLADVQMRFAAFTEMLSGQYQRIRTAIGRR